MGKMEGKIENKVVP